MVDDKGNGDPKAALKQARGITGQSEIIQSLTGQVQEARTRLDGELGEVKLSYEKAEGQLTELRAQISEKEAIIQTHAGKLQTKSEEYQALEEKYSKLETAKSQAEEAQRRLSGIIDKQEEEVNRLDRLLEEG